MITLYEGRPGGGKSYNAVMEIIRSLGEGSLVHTNILLHKSNIYKLVEKHYGVTPADENLIYYEKGEDLAHGLPYLMPIGTRDITNKYILDEADSWYNSRDWKQNYEKLRQVFIYLKQHRKLHHDITLIVQDVANLDSQFRRLAQFIYRYRDLARLAAPGIGKCYPFPHTLEIQVDYDGKTILGRRVIPRKAEIFSAYESEQLLMDNAFNRHRSIGVLKKSGAKRFNKIATDVLSCVVVILILTLCALYY